MRQIINGKLYDIKASEKICDVKNAFGYARQSIYRTSKGTLFVWDNNYNRVDSISQEVIRDYIGMTYPGKYLELFGKVEEA